MKMPKKMKIIPPTMRERKRYLLMKDSRSGMQDRRPAGGLQKKVEKAILRFVGELGYAKANPMFIHKGNYLILSINHDLLDEIRTSLSLSNIQVLRVSGTIEALMEKSGR